MSPEKQQEDSALDCEEDHYQTSPLEASWEDQKVSINSLLEVAA
jgi:hypothetical protein